MAVLVFPTLNVVSFKRLWGQASVAVVSGLYPLNLDFAPLRAARNAIRVSNPPV